MCHGRAEDRPVPRPGYRSLDEVPAGSQETPCELGRQWNLSWFPSGFELYVALRYLRAKRRDRFFSIATVISVTGVALGVAALIIAMAITNGFHSVFSEQLIGASSHITLVERDPEYGIEDYELLIEKLSGMDHIVGVAPALYGEMMITTPGRAKGCVLKGVDPEAELRVSDLLSKVVEVRLTGWRIQRGSFPHSAGPRLADTIGARVSTIVTVMSPQGEITPLGMIPALKRFQVAGIFETGFYELDNLWGICCCATHSVHFRSTMSRTPSRFAWTTWMPRPLSLTRSKTQPATTTRSALGSSEIPCCSAHWKQRSWSRPSSSA